MGGQCHAPAALTPGKNRYPLYTRLGRPQGRSGRVRTFRPPPGFDLWTLQLVANSYTDWAIPAHIKCTVLYWNDSSWSLQATGSGEQASRACARGGLEKKIMEVARVDPALFPIPSRSSFRCCSKCLLPSIVKHLEQLLTKCLQKWHKSGAAWRSKLWFRPFMLFALYQWLSNYLFLQNTNNYHSTA